MAENMMTTIIQLRNDTAENWATEAGQATALRPGEAAVEIITNEDGSKTAKLKVGVAEDSTFGNTAYLGSDVKEAKIYQSDFLASTVTDDDITVIEGLVGENELQAGDMAIVKRYLQGTSGAVSYTSYVYNPEVSGDVKWTAMDGNYSANNVFFKNDITLAGSYTSVGNVALADGTLSAAGKSVEDVLTSIFTKELNTRLKTADPSASIDGTIQYLEVGSSGSVSATIGFNDGAYAYGYTTEEVTEDGASPTTTVNSTSVTGSALVTNENAYTVTFNGADTTYASTTKSITIEAPVKKTKTNMSASIKAKYTDGYAPISNLKKAYPSQAIKAGTTASASDELFRWYIPYYKGFIYRADEKLTTVDVSKLTKVTGSTAYNASNPKTDTATNSWIQYWLVAPASYNWTMNEAKDSNGLTLDVDTTQPNIKITYGSGDNAVEVEYKVLVISHKALYDTKTISWK